MDQEKFQMTLTNSAKLAAAIGLALGSTSSFALNLATTQGIVNTAPPAGGLNAPNVLVVAGASAMRASFLQLLIQDVCETSTNTLDAYRATPTPGQDFRAYSCTARVTTTLGAASGQNVVVFYRSEGGSAWGPYSIAQRAAVTGTSTGSNFLGISALNLGAGSTCTTVAATTTLDNFAVLTHACPLAATYSLANDTAVGGLTLLQTELGTADVEPRLFQGSNNPASIPTSRFVNSPAVVSALTSLSPSTIFGQVFNIIGNANTDPLGSSVSDDVVSLKPAEVTGILSGTIGDWCQLPSLGGHQDCIDGVEHPITVVRREPGSGTQASAAAEWTRTNCGDSYNFVTAANNGAIEVGTTATLESTVGTTLDS